jgi:hypothetical protein
MSLNPSLSADLSRCTFSYNKKLSFDAEQKLENTTGSTPILVDFLMQLGRFLRC